MQLNLVNTIRVLLNLDSTKEFNGHWPTSIGCVSVLQVEWNYVNITSNMRRNSDQCDIAKTEAQEIERTKPYGPTQHFFRVE